MFKPTSSECLVPYSCVKECPPSNEATTHMCACVCRWCDTEVAWVWVWLPWERPDRVSVPAGNDTGLPLVAHSPDI